MIMNFAYILSSHISNHSLPSFQRRDPTRKNRQLVRRGSQEYVFLLCTIQALLTVNSQHGILRRHNRAGYSTLRRIPIVHPLQPHQDRKYGNKLISSAATLEKTSGSGKPKRQSHTTTILEKQSGFVQSRKNGTIRDLQGLIGRRHRLQRKTSLHIRYVQVRSLLDILVERLMVYRRL